MTAEPNPKRASTLEKNFRSTCAQERTSKASRKEKTVKREASSRSLRWAAGGGEGGRGGEDGGVGRGLLEVEVGWTEDASSSALVILFLFSFRSFSCEDEGMEEGRSSLVLALSSLLTIELALTVLLSLLLEDCRRKEEGAASEEKRRVRE